MHLANLHNKVRVESLCIVSSILQQFAVLES
jgi:hypothetical protein